MSRLRLREVGIWFGLGGVNKIGKLDGILDEEYRHVIAYDVPVAVIGIEFYREAAHIASQVGGAFVAGYGGESNERWSFLAQPLEEVG